MGQRGFMECIVMNSEVLFNSDAGFAYITVSEHTLHFWAKCDELTYL